MRRLIILLTIILPTAIADAQSVTSTNYHIGKNFVVYNDSLMTDADQSTFKDLGRGYGKDKDHVFYNGKVLDDVDPATFSLIKSGDQSKTPTTTTQPTTVSRAATDSPSEGNESSLLDKVLGTDEVENHYSVSGNSVTYNGKTIKGADAATFTYVGGDYAADKRHAYYKGIVLGDAWGKAQFKYRGNGYASDGIHWYCNGKPVDRD